VAQPHLKRLRLRSLWGHSRPAVSPAAGALVGLGFDLVDLERFRLVLARRPALAERLFTEGERGYAQSHRDPVPALAARFAAKEATMKALGVGLGAFGWHDVEVRRLDSSQPVLVVAGPAKALALGQGVGAWALTMTHTDLVAGAVVAALSG
jgi:holo-[acyl-carrier protein] synthase